MSISTGSNFLALKLTGRMTKTSAELGSTIERLSTGSRINRAGDDPAGLFIADKLRLDARLMNVALRNTNDAVSLVTVTDEALAEVGDLLSRMSELAIQGANGTYTTTQRSAMQVEFSALGSEINRISAGVSFNGTKLLSESSDIVAQVGITNDASSRITLSSTIATLSSLGLGSGAALTYSLTGTTTAYAVSASGTAYSAIQSALDQVSGQRGVVGAVAARLSSAVTNLSNTRETLITAEARIRDVDMASEAAELVRLQLLQSSQVALFTQTTQIASRVLQLLGNK